MVLAATNEIVVINANDERARCAETHVVTEGRNNKVAKVSNNQICVGQPKRTSGKILLKSYDDNFRNRPPLVATPI